MRSPCRQERMETGDCSVPARSIVASRAKMVPSIVRASACTENVVLPERSC